MFKKVVIIGLGLLGGSFAKALKKRYPGIYILGVDKTLASLENAKTLGIVDDISDNRIDAVAGADFVVIATPVNAIIRILEEIAPFIEEGTLVTDFGSTKKEIVMAAQTLEMPNAMFVGSHPIAGSEKTGYENAREDLFAGKAVVIAQTESVSDHGALILEALWRDLGAYPAFMHPEEHDMKLGVSSHLVHFAAVTLVSVLKQDGAVSRLYGTGFLDTTRVAQGDEKMWVDIVKTNKSDILSALNRYTEELATLKTIIKEERYDDLYHYLKEIKEFRNGL